MNQGSLFDKVVSPATLQHGKFTKHRGYLSVRVPVIMAAWLETMVVQKNSSDVDWHGRIPPLKDSIALRYSNLVVESLSSKVYLKKLKGDPAAVSSDDRYLQTIACPIRLRLRYLSNVEKVVRGAQEFERSISLESYFRALDSLTAKELRDYAGFSEAFKKGEYVPTTPAILKAIASKQGKATRPACLQEAIAPTSTGNA